MKNIIYIILIGALLGCNNSQSKTESRSLLNKLTCENEKKLLSNSKNNWKIPLKKINNIDDYILESNIQLKSSEAFNGIKKTKYGMSIYSNIYPYSLVNGVEIGLMPLTRITGSGYTSLLEDSFKIVIENNYNLDLNLKQKVFEFYRDFKPNTENKSSLRLIYPRIDLTFIGNSFNKLNDILEEITLGYLKSARLEAEKKFSKKICELTQVELEILKANFKLNIRVHKLGNIE